MNLFRTKYSAHKTKYCASTQYSYILVKLEYEENVMNMPQVQILAGTRQKSSLQNFQTGSATAQPSVQWAQWTYSLGLKVGYSPTIQCSPNKLSVTDRDNPFFAK
jgi:hypothetical protein